MEYLIYKITNTVNGKIYIGYHKTKNIDDGYMGSGKAIRRALLKYGEDKFTKEILFKCKSLEEMKRKEADIVNEAFVARPDTYNMKLGGHGGFEVGKVSSQKGYVSTEEFEGDPNNFGQNKGMIPVTDSEGNRKCVLTQEAREKGLVPLMIKNGTVACIDENGKHYKVTKENYDRKKHLHKDKGRVLVRDSENNYMRVDKDDHRYISGELVAATTGQNNQQTKVIIYDKKGKEKFQIINENFIAFCKDNNLPYGALVKSHQHNGSPIYQKIGSNMNRLVSTDMIQYRGWYAKRIK